MAILKCRVDNDQGLLLTVSDFRDGKYQWKITCAITGNTIRAGEGYPSPETAENAMKAVRREIAI